MEKRYDVTALGELLIDFTENGLSGQGNPLFEANPGGAPCNVLAMMNRLGKKTAFIGKVGQDQFGRTLKASLEELGIGTENLLLDKNVHTTLAFVHTAEDGDRDFSFYRKPGADMMILAEEVQEDLIASSRVFHFGTVSMTDEPTRGATVKALEYARKHQVMVTFDPNLRPPLWRNLQEAKEQIWYGLSQCSAVKMSEEELEFITGERSLDRGVEAVRNRFDIPLICITMGKQGSKAYYGDAAVEKAGFVQEHTIETTGAGDTFCASMINYILDHGIQGLTEKDLEEMLTFANAAASIITTRKGALRVMPTREEVQALLN
ncbi:MAG: carbohydrate kinase [Lachnospiraceae bacterium]|nr:carbohydrate kinase [Lachnospiraceae bacterium]